jgi:predicted unusual protein kinase regulating ubiquinone biosynthesis (AarF/ABC1/UbiB family)
LSAPRIGEQVQSAAVEEKKFYPNPSRLHVVKVMLRLLPVVLALRRDRREWVKKEGKGVNEEKYRRHAERALKTFISLGPSYIKLGQWLSSRADLLPQPYLEVLASLQDDVPPAPFPDIKPTIEREIGKIEQVFEEFNEEPLSGASLGQVYLARHQGRQVIVKVGRPNIERIIADDIYVLKKIMPVATRFIDPNLRFSAEGMLAQFTETIREEMDYRIEAENLATIKRNLAGDNSVIIPEVIMERTSKHVLTIEYVPGIKITDVEALDARGIDRSMLVMRAHRLFFKMLLRHSIFHADPHPGNISVEDSTEARLILYDFGMVGRLDNETRLKLIRLYLALLDKDPARTVNVLIELGTLEPSVNRYVVEKGIDLSIQSMFGRQVDRMEVKALMELANKTMSRFPFRLPKNLALYMRMASLLEGIYQHHKVKFQFVKVLGNLLEEEGLVRDAYIEEVKASAKRIAKGIEASVELGPMVKTFFENQQYYKQEKKSPMLAASILASALFIGSAVMLPYNALFSYAGFAAAAVAVAVGAAKR